MREISETAQKFCSCPRPGRTSGAKGKGSPPSTSWSCPLQSRMGAQRRQNPFSLSSHHLPFLWLNKKKKRLLLFSYEEPTSMVLLGSYSLNFLSKHYWKCTFHSCSSSDVLFQFLYSLFCKPQTEGSASFHANLLLPRKN